MAGFRNSGCGTLRLSRPGGNVIPVGLYQPPLKPTLGRMVPVMPAQACIHDFGRIDPQSVDGRNKPGHDGKRTPMVTPKGRWDYKNDPRPRSMTASATATTRFALLLQVKDFEEIVWWAEQP